MIRLFTETDKDLVEYIRTTGIVRQKYIDVAFNYQIIFGIKNVDCYRFYKIEKEDGDLKYSQSRERG